MTIYRGCTPGVRETDHRQRRYNASRVEDGCRRVFFSARLPTGGCQSGDGASQTKPSIRFPSCKAQCDIVPRLFYKENMRDCGGVGGRETHFQELQITTAIWRGGARVGEGGGWGGVTGSCTLSPPQPPHPSSTAVRPQHEE